MNAPFGGQKKNYPHALRVGHARLLGTFEARSKFTPRMACGLLHHRSRLNILYFLTFFISWLVGRKNFLPLHIKYTLSKKMYSINYDIKDTNRQIAFVSRAKEFGEVELYLPTALFLDSESPCSEVYTRLKECLDASDLFFITRVDPNDRNGWLNSKTIDWFLKKQVQ